MSIIVKGLKGFENSQCFHRYDSAIDLRLKKVLQCMKDCCYPNVGKSFWYLENRDYNSGDVYLYQGIQNNGFVSRYEACNNYLEKCVLDLVELLDVLSRESGVPWNYFVFPNTTSFYNGSPILCVNIKDRYDNIVMQYVFDKSFVVCYDKNKVAIPLRRLGNFSSVFKDENMDSNIALLIKKCVLNGNIVSEFINRNNFFTISNIKDNFFKVKDTKIYREVNKKYDDYEMFTCKDIKGNLIYIKIKY